MLSSKIHTGRVYNLKRSRLITPIVFRPLLERLQTESVHHELILATIHERFPFYGISR